MTTAVTAAAASIPPAPAPSVAQAVPEVTVLMTAYNAARYLREAVDSILNQTFRDFEFVIVDDGSTDRTLSILQDYARRDPRIRIISRPNTGLTRALNDGLATIRSPLIARMDADDVALPERFAKQLALLDTGFDLVG